MSLPPGVAALGKIEGDSGEIAGAIEGSGFIELPVRAQHAARVAELTEPLVFLTAVATLSRYSDLVMVV